MEMCLCRSHVSDIQILTGELLLRQRRAYWENALHSESDSRWGTSVALKIGVAVATLCVLHVLLLGLRPNTPEPLEIIETLIFTLVIPSPFIVAFMIRRQRRWAQAVREPSTGHEQLARSGDSAIRVLFVLDLVVFGFWSGLL